MSGILFPLGATVAAAGLTYWFCVRPMRRGRGCVPGVLSSDRAAAAGLDAEVASARAELHRLQARSPRTAQPNAGVDSGPAQSPPHPS